jgi:hypothetical protein
MTDTSAVTSPISYRPIDMRRAVLGHLIATVRRVERGVDEYIPGALSRSTEWRCRNWRTARARASGAG